jgi:hypothetical protein
MLFPLKMESHQSSTVHEKVAYFEEVEFPEIALIGVMGLQPMLSQKSRQVCMSGTMFPHAGTSLATSR